MLLALTPRTTAYPQPYEYDKLGNLQQLRHSAAKAADSFTRTFDYGSGATNYLQRVQLGADQVTYQYDAAGNVIQENGSRHYQWDTADQLRQFATWTGAGTAPTLLAYYVAGGQRVKKLTQTSADTWQVTVYAAGGFEHRYEVSQGSLASEQTQVAVLDGPHRLYQRRSGDALGDQRPASLYALDDHLGSAAAHTDTSGQLVSCAEYYLFGETSFGSSEKQRYRFCGKERDGESGLYNHGMRCYAPWLCRFVSVDPLAAMYAFYTPYQYAGNKPLLFRDLDGLEEVETQELVTPDVDTRELALEGLTGPNQGGVQGARVNRPVTGPGYAFDGYGNRVAAPHYYVFRVQVDISSPKVSRQVYEDKSRTYVSQKGTRLGFNNYESYSRAYNAEQRRVATQKAAAKFQQATDTDDHFKGYKYYRAMSWEEFNATGGRLQDRNVSGEGRNVTAEIGYLTGPKAFIRKDPVKYALIVEYISDRSPENLSANTRFKFDTLNPPASPRQFFKDVRDAGMWYEKVV